MKYEIHTQSLCQKNTHLLLLRNSLTHKLLHSKFAEEFRGESLPQKYKETNRKGRKGHEVIRV